MATSTVKLFGNASILAVTTGVVQKIQNLERRRNDADFDEVFEGAVALLKKARNGCFYRSVSQFSDNKFLDHVQTYDLVAPALEIAGIPGVIERDQLSWLIDVLTSVKHGMLLPEAECSKISHAFNEIARAAIG